ncbi:TonB-dependent receptor [Aestuariibaculum marinum]|uniref:TonB-dependent receptor n=1 Tax=Aestuariibaculum marinum TaxID=2683592 RepID=A0A8J6Q0J4_9FLAO|nr:TonB-dependent receptor [Aestuariibaculum marinum]MBD0822864.1 TonB-dependent receptor [Aestuariibaculum marinum]
MKKYIYILVCLPFMAWSQQVLKGHIYEANQTNKNYPLVGANVYWLNTEIGAVTDLDGSFSIPYQSNYKNLIISYVGYKTDTLKIKSSKDLKHWLKPTSSLDEVAITARNKSTFASYLKAENVMTMSSDELLKSACCNLCESFETNPSIDVNFADAITGTRQIKMLGLNSPYILTAIESVPTVRGAAQIYGLSFVPGTWVESIQVTKGTGTVINGFESIAGQINAKLQKPVEDSKLFLNLYGAANGRLELNTHLNTKVSDKLYTGLYLHGNLRNQKFDNNNDSFLDVPLAEQINIMNRWQYVDLEKGIVSFLNVRILNDEKQTGQVNFSPDSDRFSTTYWGSEIDTKRLDVSGKFSYANQDITHRNFDAQANFSTHNQQSYFGQNIYNINHNSLYSRAIYSSILSNTMHKFKTGINFSLDHYDEITGIYSNTSNYEREENSIGAFFEYNYDNLGAFNLTAGIRVDNSNLLGVFVTPRLNVRYTPWSRGSLKASLGRGKRSANIFAENQNMFASSRSINIVNSNGNIYGLDPEIAWNYGLSFMQGFNLFGRTADVVFDFYKTDFKNQVVVDWENPNQISFYNLNGTSYANSFQTEFNYNVLRGLDLRLAYKYYDVKTTYTSGKLEKPLTPKHRLFANTAYKTKVKSNGAQWKFDATYNWLGEQRSPSTTVNPELYQLPDYTPTVATVNAQITKVFSKAFEVYAGAENITNTRIQNPILGADNPFGDYFDTTLVYGPIFGSSYYLGLRYRLN